MAFIYKLPLALTMLRAALGPVVLLLALFHPIPAIFIVCLVTAFLSDVFDGVIARKLKIATAGIRRLDSIADSIFYLCACAAAYLLYPQTILDHAIPLGVLIALEISRYIFDYAKFRRETSYHMWSSKIWGILLFIGFLSLLGFGRSDFAVSLAIYAGILADMEGLLISMALADWQHDVPTLFHALKLRRAAAKTF